MSSSPTVLRVPAIETEQSQGRPLYAFAIDGKLVQEFATVSRLSRDGGKLHGYQRPEVHSHISEIRSYIESESPLVPNAIVIAFDSTVRFESVESRHDQGKSRVGNLCIPIDPEMKDADKPGFIVDGQQRLAAVRDAEVERFPLMVTAFIAKDLQEQTEQFMLVNSTKPLPKTLVYELLPVTGTRLPSSLERKRFPAMILSCVNHDPSSPMYKMVRTSTNPEGVVKDNSVLRMLENSLNDGALYRFRDPQGQTHDIDSMVRLLNNFWEATRRTFPNAWGLPPQRSRLMHGAGVVSMGFVMDAIADRKREVLHLDVEHFGEDLRPLADVCSWTHGYWDFGPGMQTKWNELQNTPRDVQVLANYLLIQYRQRVWTGT